MASKMSESDKKYQKLMGAYKVARRDPVDLGKAQTLLKAAQELKSSGKVSPEVIEGMRYL